MNGILSGAMAQLEGVLKTAQPAMGPSLPKFDLTKLDPAEVEKITKTAENFESMFLGLLLEPMEKSGEAFFGSGAEGRTFGSLFRTQLAENLAHSRPLGIADQIEKVLIRDAASRAYGERGRP